MKVNLFDTHDRFQHLVKQQFSISECCKDLVDKRPFGNYPFYIFAHARTDDDGVTKRLIWQPRLTKPRMQTNSMLFKGYPGSDQIEVFWILPERNLWDQYIKGNVTENTTVLDSIDCFLHNREKMESKEEGDLTEEQINAIYLDLAQNKKNTTPKILVAS